MSEQNRVESDAKQKVSWQKNLIILWCGVFLACASYTMVVPFLPVYLMEELKVGADTVNMWSGSVFSITFLGAAVMAPYWGARADRVGQRRMAIRAGFGLALCYCFAGLAQTATQLLAVRALTGFISGFVPASMALVSATLPGERLGWGMGLMQTAVASGSIMGPLLGGYVSDWFGMRMSFFIAAAALGCATVAVILYVRDIKLAPELARGGGSVIADIKVALHNKRLLYIMFLFFLIQSCLMIIQPLLTVYVRELMHGGASAVKAAGVIFSLAGIAGIIAAPFWGKTGQRVGYTKTLCFVFLCAGLTNLGQFFVHTIWHFGFVQFVFGLFLAGAAPNVNASLVEATDPQVRGKAFGLVTSAQQFGGVIGPLVGGFMGLFLPVRYILVFTGCVLLVAGVHIYLTKLRQGIRTR
ncbi:MAG: MFS transporter [Acidaminococcaceae bacterium]